ncbi:unnamed protein product, partial [Rotaria sordida]
RHADPYLRSTSSIAISMPAVFMKIVFGLTSSYCNEYSFRMY